MQANLRAAAKAPLHFHVNAITTDGAAVETIHTTGLDALATGRKLALEGRPGQGRIRWHQDAAGTSYYVSDAAGWLTAWVVVAGPCRGQHGEVSRGAA